MRNFRLFHLSEQSKKIFTGFQTDTLTKSAPYGIIKNKVSIRNHCMEVIRTTDDFDGGRSYQACTASVKRNFCAVWKKEGRNCRL